MKQERTRANTMKLLTADRETRRSATSAAGLRAPHEERYGNPAGTNADYVAKVQTAAQALVTQRFLIEEPGVVQDVETYTTPAVSVAIPANP